ncbi:MAG: 16S rRNA (adenine(1518)-N(6)/adenine(1519)-N(6))-dimethyltransferase RsmA [Minisyncoccia bacterium]
MIKTKKSLGQHFLNSEEIIKDIVSAGKVIPTDTVLEIGPGQGILTKKLLSTGAHVISVEKDDRLIPELQKTFVKEISLKNLDLIHADILDIGLPHITHSQYKVVANIPYYITGQIIRMFLESDKQPTSMTLLIQKEVAERIIAKPAHAGGNGKESLLSLSVKVFGNPKLVKIVPRNAFTPQPNVDSAVLNIENISKNNFSKGTPLRMTEEQFFRLIHAGFSHKRKQLLPNLSSLYKKENLVKAFDICGINLKARAEDIPLDTWIKLCNIL